MSESLAGLLTRAGHAYRATTASELRRLAERKALDRGRFR